MISSEARGNIARTALYCGCTIIWAVHRFGLPDRLCFML